MTETKHSVKRRISISIGFLVVTLIFLGIWIFIRGKENVNELIFVANIILPFLIGIGFLFTIIQFLVLDKFHYINLTDDSVIIYSVFPVKSFKYLEIKSIAYNNGWFKGVDTGSYMKWPTALRLNDSEQFLSDFKSKYRKATGRNLTIGENFL